MRIIGTGSSLPNRIVTNDELAQVVDTSDEWIRSRTGIGARRLATGETTTSMSLQAAREALANANVNPQELDLIIAATLSADHVIPMLSCEIQAELGAVNAVAFDMNAACSGFLFALATADAYMKTGRVKKALVIGAETLSKMMDWQDRGTCVLFGDGAGAVVVDNSADMIHSIVQGSDGAGGMALNCKNRTNHHPFLPEQEGAEQTDYVHMDGQAVYRFAVRTVPKAIQQALDEAGMDVEEVDLFLLHQANIRIIEAVAHRLKQPMEKFPINLTEVGNISAASIPILLDITRKNGKIKSGDKIVLAGFGAGLTWGTCVLTW